MLSGCSRPHAEALWDLEKAFDQVPRGLAVGRLLALSYPKLQLRIL